MTARIVSELGQPPRMTSTDLVTLSEAARELGIAQNTLHKRWVRGRAPGSLTRFKVPEPVVQGRTVNLWDMAELAEWWRTLDTP